MANEIAVSENQQFLSMIKELAFNKDVDVVKMQAILDMQRGLLRDRADEEANQAFSRVCRNMPRITKNGRIDFGKGQKPIPYAKWEDVQDAIRPIYEAEGFTLSFDSEPKEGGGVLYHAILQHINGNVRKSSLPLPLDTSGGKQNIQGMGSTSSYGMRYTTRNLFNLVFEGEDDDGVRGGMVFISPEQVAQIQALIDETKADVPRFMQFMGCVALENILVKDLPRALNALMLKKGKQA